MPACSTHDTHGDSPGDEGSEAEADAATSEPCTAYTGPWGIGKGRHPLSPEHAAHPLYPSIANEMGKWLAKVAAPIQHDERALPFKKTVYDKVCAPGACCFDEDFVKAVAMYGRFSQSFLEMKICDLWLIAGCREMTTGDPCIKI